MDASRRPPPSLMLIVLLAITGVVLPFVVMTPACGGSSGGADGGTDMASSIQPTWPSIYQNVIAGSCLFSSCHGSDSKMAGLQLGLMPQDRSLQAQACMNLVNVPSMTMGAGGLERVKPGEPANSFV